MTLLLVAIGGVAGVLARYGLGEMIDSIWTIAAINVVGSFLLGLLVTQSLSPELKTGLGVGFLGGFTTLSTLTVTTVVEADDGRTTTALAYLALSVGGGLVAAAAGYALGRA